MEQSRWFAGEQATLEKYSEQLPQAASERRALLAVQLSRACIAERTRAAMERWNTRVRQVIAEGLAETERLAGRLPQESGIFTERKNDASLYPLLMQLLQVIETVRCDLYAILGDLSAVFAIPETAFSQQLTAEGLCRAAMSLPEGVAEAESGLLRLEQDRIETEALLEHLKLSGAVTEELADEHLTELLQQLDRMMADEQSGGMRSGALLRICSALSDRFRAAARRLM